ncbi:Peptidase M16C associated domain protein [Coriobacterium glomerans PW2]|uniref:Peptidase M16C associated domain protein n=1 Tax=Coriobacterium glomerans (strain ATCC 49209 / DSM 20642 / JCM 10262 / PW2) TaxID=700015 RepID=F2N900_CORGP|nr:insulinase family protein [Coriobacterium glomerans]AEB07600.1 Peptidase M16C associated domain protein [Coriobacterium glomerans PW2]
MSATQSTQTDPRRAAAELLAPDTHVLGFSVISQETIEEIDADAYVLRHDLSGARLLYLACEDENKAFAIGFKTPPADDTGVFHILEHSVLCGSKRYPLKEPFVDLIKTSMQTFLNAMTFPDKTLYPVASTNEQDLVNLMSVYLDAVLNPAIYTKPAIFEQEGWHYELESPEAPLRLNGVVLNEMKGALSDPMEVLDGAIMRELFSGTAYAFESGGDPRFIPELTYERFLDSHARHYNLANSYITLYGDMDAARVLEFLDSEYLSAPTAASERAREGALAAPNPLCAHEPVRCEHARVEMRTTPDNALVGMAYVLGSVAERKRIIAADILFDALLGSNEAPVKKAVIEAGIGGNLVSYTSSACLQPYGLIILQNASPDSAMRLREIIEQRCARLVAEGIPRDRLEAVLSSNEFSLRQRDYGTADGVVLASEALSTWLYDEQAATRALRYAEVYAALRDELSGSYFEDLLREIILESEHCALVELVPIQEDGQDAAAASSADSGDPEGDFDEATRLAAKKAEMSSQELGTIIDNVAELRRQQESADSPDSRSSLPQLHVSDIGEAAREAVPTLDESSAIPCLKHDIPTRRLAYAMTYFDLSCVDYGELPLVGLLSQLMQQLKTSRHSASELDSLIGSNLGFLSFRPEVLGAPGWRDLRPVLTVSAGALCEKIDALADIPREIWSQTLFEDDDRIRDVLTQVRIGMEQGFLMSGHQAAIARAMSYVSPAALVREQLDGIEYYRFVRDVLEHFDERKGQVMDDLRDLQRRIFSSTGAIASFTGSDEDYARYWSVAGDLGLSERQEGAGQLQVPVPAPANEAFVIPSDICYVARATDPRAIGISTDGIWKVASRALSFDYLWNEIRVKGGAYGCGLICAIDRQLAFYTYRDPAIDPSLERIERAGSWLGRFEPDTATLEGLIVSSVAAHDAPIKPYALTKRQNAAYLCGMPADERARIRSEILSATPAGLREIGADVSRLAVEAPVCVFGGRDAIEASHSNLSVRDLLC